MRTGFGYLTPETVLINPGVRAFPYTEGLRALVELHGQVERDITMVYLKKGARGVAIMASERIRSQAHAAIDGANSIRDAENNLLESIKEQKRVLRALNGEA